MVWLSTWPILERTWFRNDGTSRNGHICVITGGSWVNLHGYQWVRGLQDVPSPTEHFHVSSESTTWKFAPLWCLDVPPLPAVSHTQVLLDFYSPLGKMIIQHLRNRVALTWREITSLTRNLRPDWLVVGWRVSFLSQFNNNMFWCRSTSMFWAGEASGPSCRTAFIVNSNTCGQKLALVVDKKCEDAFGLRSQNVEKLSRRGVILVGFKYVDNVPLPRKWEKWWTMSQIHQEKYTPKGLPTASGWWPCQDKCGPKLWKTGGLSASEGVPWLMAPGQLGELLSQASWCGIW